MRGSGYSEPATNEVIAALGILAKHGVLGVSVGLSHTNGTHTTPVSYLSAAPIEQSLTANGFFGAIGQVNLDSYIGTTSPTPRTQCERFESNAVAAAAAAATTAFDPFRHAVGQQAAAATPISINTNTFGLPTSTTIGGAAQALGALSKSPTPADVGMRDTKNVEIPEVIVGAILGL